MKALDGGELGTVGYLVTLAVALIVLVPFALVFGACLGFVIHILLGVLS